MARIQTHIWVSSLTRRVFSEGGFAAVEYRGASEAGAIFIRTRARDGRETLFGPAPQSYFEEAGPLDRQFECRLADGSASEIDALITRERGFDPDLWLIELEVDTVEGLFDVVSSDA